ncbi:MULTISPECIES: lipopolysaccharide assembly protein LapB [Ralstonia solanacearum species complex]|uniref:Lipopolysaccharide N-acetylglucosaminyl transferase n=10 Tax=Ralstonia solanacearum species complex TaxID=3116862 RepID=A0A0K1ZMB1_RALSL|nr:MULTISPECIES: hypothetical protein [Ralstonia]AKZ27138.1 lipopolysaccharide N-acetylglucosaminyl transferase [Ralstonia solanacearum]APC69084.1 lipopolysaccharide N-acetylglucosaminyl transferase [Ralstonia solanacearum OE1-1]ARS56698.1 lipopolysaccharide N-acetylglucosaminyl transferase [Ralstonia solanacearum FJAT-91]ESS47006.1 hypothetical protein L665_03389 [Ralstonia solanacearum SD54]AGH84743.1 Extracellular Matrix protein PelE [Ralstonia pseudosolanacearum FQY_4]
MFKLTLSGVAAQIAAVAMALHAGNSLPLLLSCMMTQGMAALLIGLAAWRLLPRRYRVPFVWSYGYLVTLCFVIPVAGCLLVLGSALIGKMFPEPKQKSALAEVGLPVFVAHLISRVTHGGGARLRAQLGNTRAPVQSRMTALVAMQTMPTRTASPVLRDLLADPVDDIRLLAYGMLDSAEKVLMQKILAELPRLEEAATTPEARYEINKRLADLYWELIYQNLVQGDVYRYTAEQVERYASAALDILPGNAALWYMRGRLALSRREADVAESHLRRAEALGFPRDRLLPPLAEACYLRRDYAGARAALAQFSSRSPLPLLRPLLRYWTS